MAISSESGPSASVIRPRPCLSHVLVRATMPFAAPDVETLHRWTQNVLGATTAADVLS
jgi:hypothetical protein